MMADFPDYGIVGRNHGAERLIGIKLLQILFACQKLGRHHLTLGNVEHLEGVTRDVDCEVA